MYATMYVARILKVLLSLWGRTERACIMITHSFIFMHCSFPYKFFYHNNYFFLMYVLFSQELHHMFVGIDDSTRVTGWEWYVLGFVWHPRSALVGVALSGVHRVASLLLVTGVCGGAAVVQVTGDHSHSCIDTTVAGMEGWVWGEVPLGRCISGSFWGSEQDLSTAWWWLYSQCSRDLSLGGCISDSFVID